jgi:rubrerythrin
MELDRMLARCWRLEERAAAVYRSFAETARSTPPLCGLWTALAREEEEHARSLARACHGRRGVAGETQLEGWEDAIEEVQRCLAAAEDLGPGAPTDRQLAAALDLEMSELEALRHALLAATDQPEFAEPSAHALRLVDGAVTFSSDPHVGLQAALLRAQVRLKRIA